MYNGTMSQNIIGLTTSETTFINSVLSMIGIIVVTMITSGIQTDTRACVVYGVILILSLQHIFGVACRWWTGTMRQHRSRSELHGRLRSSYGRKRLNTEHGCGLRPTRHA